jgi:hypothetical protein
MSFDQEAINAQLDLLAAHRRTLGVYLRQQAQLGVLAPPGVVNGIAETQSTIRRIKEQLRADSVQVEDEPNDEVQPAAVAAPSRLSAQEQRNRRAMLAKVKTIWIDGLLEQSLAKELRIALNLTEQPNAVDLPLNALVQELNHPPRLLASGTSIIEVFDQMGDALLILGAPGAGKTTLLLALARNLIARAEGDENFPIPVVFNLSSWATKQLPLKDWLVEELNTKYDVPRKLAQGWVDADVVLPLLDGLDEVAAGHRSDCVETINTYRQERGLLPLTVCSRVADYSVLNTKLRLQGAIVVQPLTKQQVDDYLERAGDKLIGVRTVLSDDVGLREMLDTPLMLSIVALAYKDKPPAELQGGGTPDERRRHLFDAYILAMFQRRGKEARYLQQRTLGWLGWLAHRMTQQAQTVFLVERLQPAWLPTRAMRLQYVLLDRLVFGLVCGLVCGLLVGLLDLLLNGLVFGLLDLLLGGLLFGLPFGLVTLFFGGQTGIDTLQQRPIGSTVLDALLGGLLGGLVYGLVFRLVYGPDSNLAGGLVSGLFFGLLGGLLGILTGKPRVFPRQVIVIERLHWVWRKASRSAVSGLGVGLSVGLLGGLVFGLIAGYDALGWMAGDPLGKLVFGLFVGLAGRLGGRLAIGVAYGLVFGLGGELVFGPVFGLVGGLSSGPLTATIRVNQGIVRSARSALLGGLVFGLVVYVLIGLVEGLASGQVFGLGGAPTFGLVGGLGGALSFGGYTCLSHIALRLVLSRNGSLPLRLIPFLDYCAERVFLRKVGGGYIFVHRLLMEHFASLNTDQPAAPPK